MFRYTSFNQEAAYIAKKREEAIAKLGEKWLMHKNNYVTKKEKK